MFSEIIAVYFEKRAKAIHTFCSKDAELMIIKAGGKYSYYWALNG